MRINEIPKQMFEIDRKSFYKKYWKKPFFISLAIYALIAIMSLPGAIHSGNAGGWIAGTFVVFAVSVSVGLILGIKQAKLREKDRLWFDGSSLNYIKYLMYGYPNDNANFEIKYREYKILYPYQVKKTSAGYEIYGIIYVNQIDYYFSTGLYRPDDLSMITPKSKQEMVRCVVIPDCFKNQNELDNLLLKMSGGA